MKIRDRNEFIRELRKGSYFLQVDLHEANKRLKAGAAKAGADSSQEKKVLEEQRRQLEEQRRQMEERAKTVDQKSRTIEEKERTLQSLDQDLKKRKAKMDQLEQQLQRVNVLTSPLFFSSFFLSFLSKCSFHFDRIDPHEPPSNAIIS